ncbi:MAG TPA: FtsW/RodA/SpoVE family cell cycle protein [bacterium]|nr:FtsW/RodA/SpoVE family cell cycle protein [bacterium]
MTNFRLESGSPERPSGPINSTLLFVVVTLVLIGVTLVYATTCHKGVAFLSSQVLRAAAGLLVLFLGAKLRYTTWNRRVKWWLLFGSVAMLMLTLVAGLMFKDVKRALGGDKFSFQPAEFAKYGLLVWLAGYFDWAKGKGLEKRLVWGLLVPGAAVFGVVGLTLLQPAVGTSFIIAVVSLAVFVIAGVRWWHVLLTVVAAVVLFVGAISFISYAHDRWERFTSGKHHQQEQSLIAIGSGGPFGRGLGEGRQKYQFLPKMYNDFIFAEIGEEFGFIGSAAVCLLYLILFLYGMRVSNESSAPFGQFLASGITFAIFLYAIVHVAVTLGVIPTTGQPLPFISSGGSALLSNLFAAGVLLNISRYKRSRTVMNMPAASRYRAAGFGRQSSPARHKVLVFGGFGAKLPGATSHAHYSVRHAPSRRAASSLLRRASP